MGGLPMSKIKDSGGRGMGVWGKKSELRPVRGSNGPKQS